jgi:hypothetical protein
MQCAPLLKCRALRKGMPYYHSLAEFTSDRLHRWRWGEWPLLSSKRLGHSSQTCGLINPGIHRSAPFITYPLSTCKTREYACAILVFCNAHAQQVFSTANTVQYLHCQPSHFKTAAVAWHTAQDLTSSLLTLHVCIGPETVRAVMMPILVFRVGDLDTNVSKEHTASTFKAEDQHQNLFVCIKTKI